MVCNKNLTDDQLEAMFKATDQEMQQVEQPMEHLIQKSNTNSRGVPDFSRTKLCSSNTTVKHKSETRNTPTAVKPPIVLTTWRST